MRSLAAATIALNLLALLILVASPAEAGGPDKDCTAVVHAAGDWGKNLNPGNTTFIAGTPGDDVVDYIPAGVAFCGLGGDDTVVVNDGRFYGGDGYDTVDTNNGYVNGGYDSDVVMTNNGGFYGGPEVMRDIVHTNYGVFDGGLGNDLIDVANFGTCISVEDGC